jgi:hypothetical protein
VRADQQLIDVPRPPIFGVIASRTISNGGEPVTIEVGMPRLATDTIGVVCGLRIQGIGVAAVHGSDSIAALYRAFVAIADELAEANRGGAAFDCADPTSRNFPAEAIRAEPNPIATAQTAQSLLAARTLPGPDGPLSIIIGRPYLGPKRDSYRCNVHSSGHRTEIVSGADEIEVLLTAIRTIGTRLHLPQDWPISRLS